MPDPSSVRLITMNFQSITENATKLWTTYVSNPTSPDSPIAVPTLNTLVLGTIVFFAFILTTLNVSARRGDKVPYKRGIPFIGSWTFFTRRYRFVEEGLKKLGGRFRFNILHVSFCVCPARVLDC